MNSFKLIGIRPHEKCHSKFLKVLEPGRMYQFYNEYEFYTNDQKFDGINGEITRYEFNQTVPDDLFRVGNLNVNISAVVGKNGTGKSSLIELLLYSIYFLGTKLKNDNGDKILYSYVAHIKHMISVNKDKIDEFVQKKNKLNDFVKNCFISPNKYTKRQNQNRLDQYHKKVKDLLDLEVNILQLEKRQTDLEKDLVLAQIEHKRIIKDLKCDIIFEIDGTVIKLVIDDGFKLEEVENKHTKATNYRIARELKLITLLSPESKSMLDSFFYSIVLNYSHHSLNAKYLGFWINTLFHKNDGYKTPAVINPMRENGKFDINHENYLAKQRLLINLLTDCLVNDNKHPKVTEKQRLYKVRFTKNEQKEIRNEIKVGNKSSKDPKDDFTMLGENTNLLAKLYEFSIDEYKTRIYNNALPFNVLIHNYISDKSLKIEEQYPEYKIKRNKDDNISTKTDRFARFLIDDNSHITFKLKQALYFLDKTSKEGHSSIWARNHEEFEFTLLELLDWMEVDKIEQLENIFTRIPPSIFKIDFLICENLEEPEPSFFEELSSGEQQKIHTVNSIIYHINNLYSVHLSKSEEERIKYQNLNVILDEIELYYHPDLQRRFIFDLLETIKTHNHIGKAEYIKGLNFIFSTHSPFILSDIPKQNILQLVYDYSEQTKNDKKYALGLKSEKQTFGANIHNLLADSFFMGEGFIGEFAKRKIQIVLDNLNELKKLEFRMEKNEIWNTIQLLGEPFLKNKLSQMYFEKFPNDDKLDSEISALRAKLESLEMIKNQEKYDSN